MTTATLPDNLEIAPGYTISDWKKLKLNPKKPDTQDWGKAIQIFNDRIRCRFLTPVDKLIALECDLKRKTFGFAILAIYFLVIETLEGFRQGMLEHNGISGKLVTDFLKEWDPFRECVPAEAHKARAQQIYSNYRCDLHHQGQTMGAFRVKASGPVLLIENNDEFTINRTGFHEKLKLEFDQYLKQLRESGKEKLRSNFLKKMNYICGLHL